MTLTNTDREAIVFLELEDGRLIYVTRAREGNIPWRLFIGVDELHEVELEGWANYYPCSYAECDIKDTVHPHRNLSVVTKSGQLWVPGEGNKVAANWQDATGVHSATVLPMDFVFTEVGPTVTVMEPAGV